MPTSSNAHNFSTTLDFSFLFLVLRCVNVNVSATVRRSYTQLHHRKMWTFFFVKVFFVVRRHFCHADHFCVSQVAKLARHILIARMVVTGTHTRATGSAKMSIWVRECITKYCFHYSTIPLVASSPWCNEWTYTYGREKKKWIDVDDNDNGGEKKNAFSLTQKNTENDDEQYKWLCATVTSLTTMAIAIHEPAPKRMIF